jgi:hypothetical protein
MPAWGTKLNRLIVNTPASGLNFLGVGGVPVINAHRQIKSVLQHKFGDMIANMLAEPKRTTSNGPIDWYTELDGDILKLTAVPNDFRNRKREELNYILDLVRHYANGLTDKALSTRILSAITFPSDEFIYLVGDQIVIVCWGSSTELPDTKPHEVTKRIDGLDKKVIPAGAQEAVSLPVVNASEVDNNKSEQIADDKTSHPNELKAYPNTSKPFNFRSIVPILLIIMLLGLCYDLYRDLSQSCGISLFGPYSNIKYRWCRDSSLASLQDDTKNLQSKLDDLNKQVADAPKCDETPIIKKKKEEEEVAALKEQEDKQRVEKEQEEKRQETARKEEEDRLQKQKEQEELAQKKKEQEEQAKLAQEIEKRKKELKAKEGEIQVTLYWNNRTDLDLIVVCPDKSEISYKSKRSCGGELDIDMNYGGSYSDNPIENVYIPKQSLQSGNYGVVVVNQSESGPPVSYTLSINHKGEKNNIGGILGPKQSKGYTIE